MKKRKRRSAADDLTLEQQLDAELARVIVEAVERVKATGMYVVVKLPGNLLGKLLEFEERHGREQEEN
jgi:hypothetical protein